MRLYYEDQWVTLYHGDCREWMPTADVLVTDPPYGVDLGNHGETRPTRLGRAGYASYEDTPESYQAVVVPAIVEALSKTKRGAVFGVAPSVWMLPAPSTLGAIYIPSCVARSPWGFQNLSTILLYGVAPDLNLGAHPTVMLAKGRSEVELGHPCPKPLQWMTWLIDLATKPGETVLDPFAGSGTTLFAAKSLGRKSIGIEINEDYCEIAARRCSQEVLGLSA